MAFKALNACRIQIEVGDTSSSKCIVQKMLDPSSEPSTPLQPEGDPTMRKTILFLSVVLLSTAMLQAQSQARTPNHPNPFGNNCAGNRPGPASRQNEAGGPRRPAGLL